MDFWTIFIFAFYYFIVCLSLSEKEETMLIYSINTHTYRHMYVTGYISCVRITEKRDSTVYRRPKINYLMKEQNFEKILTSKYLDLKSTSIAESQLVYQLQGMPTFPSLVDSSVELLVTFRICNFCG